MRLNKTDREILLVYPGKLSKVVKPEIPLQLLYLAAILKQNGFRCRILDMRVEDYKTVDLRETLCVGITSMTGLMIKYGLDFARYIRYRNPEIPIIWGGVHPSLLPEETVSDPLVDIVVRGEGELTLLEIAHNLSMNRPIDKIPGTTYKDRNRIVSNPPRNFIDLNSIPIDLPYNLIDLERYDISIFPIHTSRGCPHRCAFCYNQSYHAFSYRYKSPERVLDEIEYIVNNFSPKTISFTWEDNFFARRKRVEEILKGIIRRGLKIRWESFCRFDYASNFTGDFWNLLEETGCVMLSFGGESGSQELLDSVILKDVRLEQMLKVTERMAQTKIKQIVSFMSGFPREKQEDLMKTFAIIDRLAKINPSAEFNGIFFFTPYPGTSLIAEVQDRYHFEPPRTLREWADYQIYREARKCTWLEKGLATKLKYLSIMTRFPFYSSQIRVPDRFRKPGLRQAYVILCRFAQLRWKYRFFAFPIEWRLLEKVMEKYRGYV